MVIALILVLSCKAIKFTCVFTIKFRMTMICEHIGYLLAWQNLKRLTVATASVCWQHWHIGNMVPSSDAVLESRSITVFIPGKKFGDDIDQQMTFPVQCSFWSFVDMDSSSRRTVQKTSVPIGQMVRTLNVLLWEYCWGGHLPVILERGAWKQEEYNSRLSSST